MEGWIPIKDGLVELKKIVREIDKHRSGKRFLAYAAGSIQIAHWWEYDGDDDAHNFIGEGGWVIFPTHWQNLPDPPADM